MDHASVLTGRNELYSGKFLSLKLLDYRDRTGRLRHWECASRVNSRGAAVLVPKMIPSGRYLLIRQFRAPMGCYVIEFPAGLIDPGETAEETAVRELYEETGCRGRVTQSLPSGCSSPGMTDETFVAVFMEIPDADYPVLPEPHPEGSEDIEVFAVSEAEVPAFFAAARQRGDAVDGKLGIFFAALAMNRQGA